MGTGMPGNGNGQWASLLWHLRPSGSEEVSPGTIAEAGPHCSWQPGACERLLRASLWPPGNLHGQGSPPGSSHGARQPLQPHTVRGLQVTLLNKTQGKPEHLLGTAFQCPFPTCFHSWQRKARSDSRDDQDCALCGPPKSRGLLPPPLQPWPGWVTCCLQFRQPPQGAVPKVVSLGERAYRGHLYMGTVPILEGGASLGHELGT